MQQYTDLELRQKTDQFRKRLQKGETLNDILIEAFAVKKQLWCHKSEKCDLDLGCSRGIAESSRSASL